jgi:hypothetical protein
VHILQSEYLEIEEEPKYTVSIFMEPIVDCQKIIKLSYNKMSAESGSKLE